MRTRGRKRNGGRLLVKAGGGAAAPAPWTPASLPSLAAWYTAGPSWCFTDAGGTVAAGDGDMVRVWKDRSGNARDLSQATASLRPILYDLGGGVWVASYDGVDDVMKSAAWQPFPLKRGTIAVAADMRSATSAGALVSTYSAGATPPRVMWYCRTANAFVWFDESNLTGTAAATGRVVRQAVRTGDTTVKVYAGGVLVDTLTVANNQPTANPVAVGNDADGSNSAPLDVYEVVITGAAVSDADRASLDTYLGV